MGKEHCLLTTKTIYKGVVARQGVPLKNGYLKRIIVQKNSEKVAVVLAACNGGRHLRMQLESILRQTRLPDIILVADDVSDDDTLNIIEDFSNSTRIVRYIKNEKRIGHVRNFEMLLSKVLDYDYVFLSDQDDFWYENKIDRMLDVLRMSGGLVFSNADIVDENGGGVSETWFERIASHGGAERAYGLGCTTALSSRLLRAALPIPKGSGHDVWLHFVAANLGCRYKIDESLMHYRIHSSGTSKSKAKQKPIDGFKYLKMRGGVYKIARNIPLVLHHVRRFSGLARAYVIYKFIRR